MSKEEVERRSADITLEDETEDEYFQIITNERKI